MGARPPTTQVPLTVLVTLNVSIIINAFPTGATIAVVAVWSCRCTFVDHVLCGDSPALGNMWGISWYTRITNIHRLSTTTTRIFVKAAIWPVLYKVSFSVLLIKKAVKLGQCLDIDNMTSPSKFGEVL